MSSLRNLFIIALLSLSACGFKPMYASKTSTPGGSLKGVLVEKVEGPGRMAQQLKADLEDKLNPGGAVPANPTYRLNLSLTSAESAIGVARDGTVSRYNVYLTSVYTLTRIADNKKITSGTLQQVSSYNNATNQYFSTFVSQGDASKRGVTELAEMYHQRLSPYLAN